ncbi:sensor histidine kinase [Jannaschia aquimarina]|uniref:histidine kinase n=1 Tax=Jannaschia aquimarina TaxID=935700 RepID=A0A0D1EDX4_9RHOB|nr:ATP-binding protein [Jannaschia aquimarina]KIT15884.1 Blue-light-activated protein [Jannaschia aquimarina]SNS96988.1 Signal transduction histidine kinase [Jannaschia aquimarina]
MKDGRTIDPETRLAAILDAAKPGLPFFLTRSGLLLTAATMAGLLWGNPWVALPVVGYILFDLALRRRATALREKEVGCPQVWQMIALHAGAALCYDILALTVALSGTVDAVFAGLMLLSAHALYGIAIAFPSRDLALVDFVTTLFFSHLVLMQGSGLMSATSPLVLHIALLVLNVAYGHALWQAHRNSVRMRQTTRRLARAERAEVVGQLTSGIAHDFNNLLTVMRGNLDLLAHVPPAERPILLRQIEDAAARGADLVRSLSQTCRDGERDTARAAIGPALRKVREMSDRVLPSNIRLEIDLRCNGTLAVATRPAQLEMVLLNLVVNARDAMDHGGEIRIEADHAGGEVRLTVSDDGAGMAPQVLARATEAYETTKPPGMGTGLGLAMVSSVVDEAGGRLRIESEQGAGTRVSMAFPAHRALAGVDRAA